MTEVAAGIVISDGCALCFRKGPSKHPYLSGKFEFAGGKLEKGENPEQALVREFREELDTDISNAELKHLISYEYTYPDFSVTLHFIIVKTENFTCTLREHTEIVSMPLDRLDELDWADGDKQAVQILTRCQNA